METAGNTVHETCETRARAGPRTTPALSATGSPTGVEPDLEFILTLCRTSGDYFLKCFQCGTCSATCALAPDDSPFPRKEMAWANWGMKECLVRDADVWLCYQCNDCSTRCPRGARPGDLLAAIRQQSVMANAFPRFLGRWVNDPKCIPLLLGIPTALLSLVLWLKIPLADALGIGVDTGERIVYSYSSVFPHWLLNGFFFTISALVLLVTIVSVGRFWHGLNANAGAPVKGLWPSIGATLKGVFVHDNFTSCTRERPRYWSHLLVFFGFLALGMVTLWVITAGINPLMQKDFVYPFGFWNPWKLLANAGGAALLAGLSLMIFYRSRNTDQAGAGSYFDWTLISTLLLVILTGFFTEILHYLRLEPHRHIIYFVHLLFVCALILYLPYSKFAHLVYRTTALVHAEYTGRKKGRVQLAARDAVQQPAKEEIHA